MWLTSQERRMLAGLGAAALAGWGVLLWMRHRPPLTLTGSPSPHTNTVGVGASPVEVTRWEDALASARRVDVNTAGVAELERLPGVGPTLAHRIAEDRTRHGRFRTPEELSRVPGIGPKTLDAMKRYVTVGD